jgi:hypothetical protein
LPEKFLENEEEEGNEMEQKIREKEHASWLALRSISYMGSTMACKRVYRGSVRETILEQWAWYNARTSSCTSTHFASPPSPDGMQVLRHT